MLWQPFPLAAALICLWLIIPAQRSSLLYPIMSNGSTLSRGERAEPHHRLVLVAQLSLQFDLQTSSLTCRLYNPHYLLMSQDNKAEHEQVLHGSFIILISPSRALHTLVLPEERCLWASCACNNPLTCTHTFTCYLFVFSCWRVDFQCSCILCNKTSILREVSS